MRYEIGEDGILTQIDDEVKTPQSKPATTTSRPATTVSQSTSTTTTRRPSTTTTRPSTTTTTTPRRPRVSINVEEISHYLTLAYMAIAVGLGIIVVVGNFRDSGVIFFDYLTRIWHNLVSAWNHVDPFYGFSVVLDMPEPTVGPLELLKALFVDGEIFELIFFGVAWFVSMVPEVISAFFQGLATLFSFVFALLA